MAPALILTEEKAAEHGFAGVGPFAFSGVFPGVYEVGRPVELSELGFADEDDAQAAIDGAFGDDVPLEFVDVKPGEGKAIRVNHAMSEHDNPDSAIVDEVVEEQTDGKIRTHADADAVGAGLGVTFPEGAKLADKIAAIDELRAGADLTAAADEPTADVDGDEG